MEDDWVDIEPGIELSACDNISIIPSTSPDSAQQSIAGNLETVHRSDENDQSRINAEAKQNCKLHRIDPSDLTELLESIENTAASRLARVVFNADRKIFKTNLEARIFDVFVSHLPTKHHAEMKCDTCFKFLKRYGTLAMVDLDSGDLIPFFWDPSSLRPNNVFYEPVSALCAHFRNKKVTRELKVTPELKHIGQKQAGGFNHMHFEFPASQIVEENSSGSTSTTQERVQMLEKILRNYDQSTVEYVAWLILKDNLSRAYEHKPPVQWLNNLKSQMKVEGQTPIQRHNLVYHHAASAFAGCLNQLLDGALAILLRKVQDSKDLERIEWILEIERTWRNVTDPRSYLNPQFAPSKAKIAAAEKLWAELGLTEYDMRREYLTSDGVPIHAIAYRPVHTSNAFKILSPLKENQKTAPKTSVASEPVEQISFAKFVDEILPTATDLEYDAPLYGQVYFFITGLPGAKPLMKFQNDENLASWYTHSMPVDLSKKGVEWGWTPVDGIIAFPNLWDSLKDESHYERIRKSKRKDVRYLVQLPGMAETNPCVLCLFPSLLKAELYGVRSIIGAYSREGEIEIPGGGWNRGRPAFVGGIEINLASLARGDKPAAHRFRAQSVVYELE